MSSDDKGRMATSSKGSTDKTAPAMPRPGGSGLQVPGEESDGAVPGQRSTGFVVDLGSAGVVEERVLRDIVVDFRQLAGRAHVGLQRSGDGRRAPGVQRGEVRHEGKADERRVGNLLGRD